MLGTARHYLALARLASALEALIAAGVTIIEAWSWRRRLRFAGIRRENTERLPDHRAKLVAA